jgi:hypothetical protein
MVSNTRDIEVSDDHILLSDILTEQEISVKRLAMLTGRAAPTIYKYCSGEATIPSIIWRSLYKLTGDARITELLTGDVPVMVVPLKPLEGKIDRVTWDHLLKIRHEAIEFERGILAILADHEIDCRDKAAISKLKKEFPAMIRSLSQLFQAITGTYDLNINK